MHAAQRATLLASLLCLPACYDGAVGDLPSGALGCAEDGRCPANHHCATDGRCWADGTDPVAVTGCDAGRCPCTSDANCAFGDICDRGTCAGRCRADVPCAVGVCSLDGGVCVECLASAMCSAPRPICDPSSRRCVSCAPSDDRCPSGQYCDVSGDEPACATGCNADIDCTKGGADQGIPADGGAPLSGRCDRATHRCVACLVDADCPLGRLCAGGACAAGCSGTRGCPDGARCCDGACVDDRSDRKNCGACGVACHDAESCCAGQCVDTSTDVAQCGSCGRACARANTSGVSCAGGLCRGTCVAPWADCNADFDTDGCEVDTASDPASCGGCGMGCSANRAALACAGRKCVGACDNGFADCDNDKRDNGCEVDTRLDAKHCGGCGRACSSNNVQLPKCAGGTCTGTCAVDTDDCNGDKLVDGCERNLLTDPRACGACNRVCSGVGVPSPACAGGVCSGDCAVGLGDCNSDKLKDGCEVNLRNDARNCGACGRACSNNNVGTTCSDGVCAGACSNGYADCNTDKQADGCEVNTRTDLKNCGSCGSACSTNNIGANCMAGQCGGACTAGWVDCNADKGKDGCEVFLAGDAMNCGACSVSCSGNNVPNPLCSNSACVGQCAPGFLDCNRNKLVDGCEIDGEVSLSHCGACMQACSNNNIARACASGSCESGVCNNGYADCDQDKRGNGCERNTTNDPSNCGACGRACVVEQLCSAGSCVCIADVQCTAKYANRCVMGRCQCNLGAACVPGVKVCTLAGCRLDAGQPCQFGVDCASGTCTNGRCA